MPAQEIGQQDSVPSTESDVRALYGHLLASWNLRHAADFAGVF